MDGKAQEPEEESKDPVEGLELTTESSDAAAEQTPVETPKAESAPEPTVVTKEVEKQVIVKQQASDKTPKTVERVVERVVEAPAPMVSTEKPSRAGRWAVLVVLIVILLAVAAAGWVWLHAKEGPVDSGLTSTSNSQSIKKSTAKVQGLQLDPNKNYGDKYADGVLPVGDGKYVVTTPKAGYVYACSQYAQNWSSGQGGAGTRGPWFTNNNTEYDINKKASVQGNVMWTADFSNKIVDSTRIVITNDLPTHPTGTFPIASTDPAYEYDRNPNSIKGQTLTYALNANPTYNATPHCMGGESGIMLTGVALFNAFDAEGRDAGAWEVQDGCQGHPEKDGIYHYHTLSSCIKDVSVRTVIGYALDGFPITGPNVGTKNVLTTSDLDECHGIVSQITLDGKATTTYHYVMTEDFPYSVSCFRGTAITPPDLALSQQTGSASQSQRPAPPRP